ncbi:hypothetical protein CYMTET_33733 [Cymbomonas tetramitiformis]|uniref:Uncharacterized protein n=1 Tax=Cymbomonas tetramitiformis TaxID=36881 RepID=A0AAE0FCK5_9CHLO|nr:hypothetical protein CYMTET_33733 [Cymbomonas tetramitiformis]
MNIADLNCGTPFSNLLKHAFTQATDDNTGLFDLVDTSDEVNEIAERAVEGKPYKKHNRHTLPYTVKKADLMSSEPSSPVRPIRGVTFEECTPPLKASSSADLAWTSGVIDTPNTVNAFLDLEDQLHAALEHTYKLEQELLKSKEAEKAAKTEVAARQEAYTNLQDHIKTLLLTEADGENSAMEKVVLLEKMIEAERTLRVAAEASVVEKNAAMEELRAVAMEIPALKADAEAAPLLRTQLNEMQQKQYELEAKYNVLQTQFAGTPGGKDDMDNTASVWRQLADLQALYMSQSAELDVLRDAKVELASMRDINLIASGDEGTSRAKASAVVIERDHARQESRGWRTKFEKLKEEHGRLASEVNGGNGLRERNAKLLGENTVLGVTAESSAAIKAENMRLSSEVQRLTSEMRQYREEVAPSEIQAVETALRAKLDVLQHQHTKLLEDVDGPGGVRSELARVKSTNSTLRDKAETGNAYKENAERQDLMIKGLKAEVAKLQGEKDALTEVVGRAQQSQEKRAFEMQQLRAELAKATNDQPPSVTTALGAPKSPIVVPTSSSASGAAVLQKPLPEKASSGSDWIARQFEWNQTRLRGQK